MIYTRWTDDELRRVLGANPDDADAVAEAARRFEDGALSQTELVAELEHDIEESTNEAEELRDDIAKLEAKLEDLEAKVEELEEAGAGLL